MCPHQKHFRISLDSKLNLNNYVEWKIKKCDKKLGPTKRLSENVPQNVLLTIYKSFIWPHVHYLVVLHGKLKNENF